MAYFGFLMVYSLFFLAYLVLQCTAGHCKYQLCLGVRSFDCETSKNEISKFTIHFQWGGSDSRAGSKWIQWMWSSGHSDKHGGRLIKPSWMHKSKFLIRWLLLTFVTDFNLCVKHTFNF